MTNKNNQGWKESEAVPQDVIEAMLEAGLLEVLNTEGDANFTEPTLEKMYAFAYELLRAQRAGGEAVDGWKLVPVAATGTMHKAVNEADDKAFKEGKPHGAYFDDVWSAALASAPTPLFTPPQANNATEHPCDLLVAAAYRKAAELAEECADQQDMVAGALAAAKHIRNSIPANAEAALREVMHKGIKVTIEKMATMDSINDEDINAIVNSVLEGKSW